MTAVAAGPLFIGMDAMDSAIVRALAADGRLPVLGRMLASWDVAPTRNPLGLVVGGLWPSFWSGSGPGHHGSYCYRQVVPGGWETADTRPTDIDVETFWAALDREGHRCTVVDVPLLAPRPLEHGRVIGDWGTHDRQLPFACEPAALADQVVRLAGAHPIDGGRCDTLVDQRGHRALYDALGRAIDQRVDLVHGLLAEPDDLLLAVFSEAHCAGHHFWHLHDRDHLLHDAALSHELDGDPLAAIYERLDGALGRLLDAAGDRPTMVLLSHGIGAHYDANHLLDEILQRIEATTLGATGAAVRVRATAITCARVVSRHARRRTGWGRQPVPRKVGRLVGSRRWYAVPNNDLYGGIRLNLRGREPAGLIDRGAQEREIIALLSEELLALRNDDTGQPAVREVIRTDDHHGGPRRDWLPDLFVAWDWSSPHRSLSSATVGTVVGQATHIRTGDHRPGGTVLARGLALPTERPVPIERIGGALAQATRHPR